MILQIRECDTSHKNLCDYLGRFCMYATSDKMSLEQYYNARSMWELIKAMTSMSFPGEEKMKYDISIWLSVRISK